MAPIEIVFVIIGIALLVISCFLTRENAAETEVTQFSEEVLEFQKKEAEKLVQQLLEEKTEEAVVKADDYLSKISNEKIMAVNEFSGQILERIDGNHKEVVFLYDMLTQKEEELKQVIKRIEAEKQQILQDAENADRTLEQQKAEPKKTDVSGGKKSDTKKNDTRTEESRNAQAKPVVATTENLSNGQMEFTEILNSDGQKEEILKMHKQGKSILEISKALGMGQGEVKLIIGLYGL